MANALVAAFEILSFGAIIVLVVLGLGIIASMMGIFNFAQGEFVLLGAYITYLAYSHGLPVWTGMVAAPFLVGALGFILEALSEGEVTVTAESGKRRLPLAIPPLQKPHPPLWYGVHSPEAAERAARRGMNVVGLDTVAELEPAFARFRAVWKETRGDAPLPKVGLGRFIVVGKNANETRAVARRAYRRWYESFTFLSSLMGVSHRHSRPPEFDAIAEDGRAFAGTPEDAAEYVKRQLAESGANYFVGQFAFGNLTLEETLRSIALFSDEVMTMLGRAPARVDSA